MAQRTLGVILAGGRSLRFGDDKALALLDGKSLIAWVAARLEPQVDLVAVNANGMSEAFSDLRAPVFADADDNRDGPLAGVLAALALADAQGFDDLVTVPCDAPGLRPDLVSRLRFVRESDAASCAFAEVDGTINAVFALYRVTVRAQLERIFHEGVRAPRDLPRYFPAATAKFTAAEAHDFRDIDTRRDLERYGTPSSL